jgi:hypothetical protein
LSKRRVVVLAAITFPLVLLVCTEWYLSYRDRCIAGELEKRGAKVCWEYRYDAFGEFYDDSAPIDPNDVTADDYRDMDVSPRIPPSQWRFRRALGFHRLFPRGLRVKMMQLPADEDAIRLLNELSSLHEVDVKGSALTREDIDRLDRELPGRDVGYFGPLRLSERQ